MKTSAVSLFLIVMIGLALKPSFAFPFNDEEQKKEFSETFPVDKATLVDISNKMGSVHIKNWEKAEVSIKVVITVKNEDKKGADNLFEKISITLEKQGNVVKAQTEIKEKIKNVDFSIDYEVVMPSYLNINLNNKFGDVIIEELKGKSNIEVKYGTLEAKKIMDDNTKPLSQITLGYCSSSKIEELNWAKLDIKYSKIKLEKSKALVIMSKYSTLKIGQSSSLVFDSGFDNIKIEEVQNLVITSKFTDVDVEVAVKKVELEMSYGGFKAENIKNGFEMVKADAKYASVKLGVEKGTSFYLESEVKYADITAPEGELSRLKNTFSEKVYGWVGSNKNSKSKIVANSEYGNIKVAYTE